MLLILSPAKTFQQEVKLLNTPTPWLFKKQTTQLLQQLKTYDAAQFKTMMKLSETLSVKTYEMYQQFDAQPKHQALFAFSGEVYKALDASTLSENALVFAKPRLMILSGLYGMLKPDTLIYPYRLEMGLTAKFESQTLVKLWKPILTEQLSQQLSVHEGEKSLLNLASTEYEKAVDLAKLSKTYRVVTVAFKEQQGDTVKVVGMYAKKARGRMLRYILTHELDQIDEIKQFNEDGYLFNEVLSTELVYVFTRQK